MLVTEEPDPLCGATGPEVGIGKSTDLHGPSGSLFQCFGYSALGERPINGKHQNAGCDPAEKQGSCNPEPFRDPKASGGGLLDEHVNAQAIPWPRELSCPKVR